MLTELSAYTQLRAGASRKVRLSTTHNDRVALQQVVTRLSRGQSVRLVLRHVGVSDATIDNRALALQSCRRLHARRGQDLLRQERQRHQGAVPRARAARRHRVHLLAEKPQVIAERRLRSHQRSVHRANGVSRAMAATKGGVGFRIFCTSRLNITPEAFQPKDNLSRSVARVGTSWRSGRPLSFKHCNWYSIQGYWI